MPNNKQGFDSLVAQVAHHHRINAIEVVYPGRAFPWNEDTAVGLYILTNLTADDINNREKGCLFPSTERVWRWAERVAKLTERRVCSDR